jgi:integrase
MKNDMIETFLNKRLITSPNTRESYRVSIQSYFKILDKDMDTYFKHEKSLEKYENDLNKVYMTHEQNEKPLLSRRTWFSGIKQFMVSSDKRLKDLEFWGILKARTKGAEPASKENILNQNDIKEILSYGNTLNRAMFLMLASSGRRIGEILALYPEDVDLTVTPATISIKKGLVGKQIMQSTKTRQQTICFISDEAKNAYIAWMKERDAYLKNAVNKCHFHKKDPNDRRVFPMGYDNVSVIWKKLLVKAGQCEEVTDNKTKNLKLQPITDKKTKRGITHPHCLRKFYRSYLGDSDLAEYLMGHGNALTRTYRQLKKEDIAQKYLNVMPNVTIFEHAPDLSGIHEDMKQKDEKIQKLEENQRILELTLQSIQNSLEIERMKNGNGKKDIKK